MLWTYFNEAAAICLLLGVSICLYRVYFSPLSRFPGPKLAAATLLYEGYYDLIKDGQYPWKIREMHKQYGPVVRVNPREVHIEDPDYVDQLYSQRLDKDPWFSRSFGIPLAGFGTWNHDLHRQRRGAINRFFSKASIASRAEVIQDKVLKLCESLKPYVQSGEVVQMDAGFICLTLDVIAEFCYGVNYNYLDVPGYDREFKAMIENVFGSGAFNRQVPIVMNIMSMLPVWLVMRLMPQVSGILRLQEMVRVQAKRILAMEKSDATAPSIDEEGDSGESYYDTELAGVSRKTTIFDQIVGSKLSREDKSEERLVQEGQSLIAAGSETTSRVLYLSLVHLYKQPTILARLRQELQGVMPDPTANPSLAALEKLPYLTAVIKESIRLGGSTATRTARISPSSQPLRYKEWIFPPGTPVSVTLFDVMSDENLFPKPEVFDPNRWLVAHKSEDGSESLVTNAALDKYMVAFSRGPRMCVGMWLAWAELYLTLAHVHRKFDMELYETEIEDVAAACDRFSCFARPGNRGVRVKITGLRS